ncbi:MAG: hypothetical protein KDB27_13630 [Planctomycetales bacterium]|nr:hypothetical protein [Planctomycetales bacterium]
MIEITTYVWFVAGIVAGCLHAMMLWRASHRLTAWTPALGMLRLSVVSAVLVLSALSGEILVAAAGWAIGLATLSLRFMVNPAPVPSNVASKER